MSNYLLKWKKSDRNVQKKKKKNILEQKKCSLNSEVKYYLKAEICEFLLILGSIAHVCPWLHLLQPYFRCVIHIILSYFLPEW